jgi:hypothetical protein
MVIRAEDLNRSRLLAISSGQFKLIHTSRLYPRERADQIQLSERAIGTLSDGIVEKKKERAWRKRSSLNTVKLEF